MNTSKNLLASKFITFLLLLVFTVSTLAQNAPPIAEIRNVTDEYFGVKITDPYRWMEDQKSDEMQKWLKAQATYADAYLKKLPLRDGILKRLNELSDAGTRVGDVRKNGGRYFYLKILPGDNNYKLYVRDGLNGAERLLVDPAKFSVGGKQASISDYSPSPNGKLVSFLIAAGGGEYGDIRVMDAAIGKETGDLIENTRWNAGLWTPDSRAFSYNKFQTLAPDAPPTERLQKIRSFLHIVGAKTDADKPLFGYGVNPNITLNLDSAADVYFPAKAKYAVANFSDGVSPYSDFYFAPISSINQSTIPWRKIINLEDEVSAVREYGDYLYLLTSKNTPRFKIIRVNLAKPDFQQTETVFPASDAVIIGFGAAKDAMYVNTLDGGSRRVFRIDYKTLKSSEVKIPNHQGSITMLGDSLARDGILLSVNSWTKSGAVFEYDPKTNTAFDTKLVPPIPIDMSNIEVVNTKVKSYDGTLVPIVILHKKGLKLDGANPVLMDGYGAYGIESTSPRFTSYSLPWLERGGVYVLAAVRGGGEYGEEWHLAGKGKTKSNTWKDFIACAEYLIEKNYTSPKNLGIQGGSAGGVLISNAIAERPELFGAAIINVGLNNILRAELTANGVANITEFGTFKTEEGFKSLLAMDGYLKIKDGVKYPAVLLTHGANDPRVETWMSAKMAARLQSSSTSGKPILLRIDYDAGHGIGSSRKQWNEAQADTYAFLFQQLGVKNR